MTENKRHRNKALRRKFTFILLDVCIVSCSFLFFAWIKPATKSIVLPAYTVPFLYFLGIWVLISVLISKFDIHKAKNSREAIIPVIIANLTIFFVVITLIYLVGNISYSRIIVFGTIFLSGFIEIFLAYFYFSYLKPVYVPDAEEIKTRKPKFYPVDKTFKTDKQEDIKFVENREQVKEIIINESGKPIYDYISQFIDVGNPKNLLVSTTTQFNIDKLPAGTYNSIANLHRINDFRRINKFFESVNTKLPLGGIYIDNAETFGLRKKRILQQYPPIINRIYYMFDFIFMRGFPKLPILKNFYFYATLGRNRVLSRAETLGRLYSCGFEVLEEKYIEGDLYFTARKTKKPYYDETPSYGPLFKMNRIGKNGKTIGVYKFRTMHPYAEYLQDYVVGKYGLSEEGKVANDFRLNFWGKFLRKYWLDELPQLINVFKGDMKLVGVRPLSRNFFNLYSDELKEKRLKHKPGLIPPFYVDLPKSLEEIMESELKYLELYEKKPFKTDFVYFRKAFFNIVFRRARST